MRRGRSCGRSTAGPRRPSARPPPTNRPGRRLRGRRGGEWVGEEFDFVGSALPNHWLPVIEWGRTDLAAAMDPHHRYYDYPAHYLRVSGLFGRPFWRDHVADSYFMVDAFG